MSTIDRGKAKAQGQEAVRVIHVGVYTAPDGRVVNIADALAESVQGTVSYPPDAPLPAFTPPVTTHGTKWRTRRR